VSSNGINIIITTSSSSSHMMSHADTASCDVTKTVTVATAHIAAAAQIIQSYSSAGANMHPCILTLKV